jgi:MscS family membrane protein
LIFIGLATASAQESESEAPETALAEPTPVPDAVRSPRATMRTFLTSIIEASETDNASRIDDAAACLDLSGLNPIVREKEGPRLAVKLKGVLDRLERIDYEDIPNEPEAADPWVYPRERRIRISRNDAGAWLFDTSTVAAIDGLYIEYEQRPTVAGVADSGEALLPGYWIRSKMPAPLRRHVFLLENWQWVALLILAFIGVLVDRLLTALARVVLISRLRRWLKDVETDLMNTSLRPYGLVGMALAWRLGIEFLDLPSQVYTALIVSIRFVGVTGFVWGSYRMVDVATEALKIRAQRTSTRFDDLMVPLFHRSLKIFIATFGIVFIADTMNVPIASLLAGLGIGGLAFAFAAQDLVANLFGSLTIVLDRPFEVGDWVKIGDLEGTVELVGFRSTRIRTFYDSQITMPNSQINTAAVDNIGRRRYRRWSTTLCLTYDTPPEKIEAFVEGIRELVRLHPLSRKDGMHIYLNEFGAASLDVMLYVFFKVPDWSAELAARHRLAIDIVRLAERLGVEFAFPTQTLYLKRGAAVEPHSGTPASLQDIESAHVSGRDEATAIVRSAWNDSENPSSGASSPIH